MSKWSVVLYLPGVVVVATEDETIFGKAIEFDSLEEAEAYGRSKGVVYEPVRVEEEE